jgi:hypothetical protein
MSPRMYCEGVANGQFPEIREHFQKNIGDVYKGLDLDFRGFPESNIRDAEACTYYLLRTNVADEKTSPPYELFPRDQQSSSSPPILPISQSLPKL